MTESTQQLALLQLYGSYSVDSVNNDDTPTPDWYEVAPLSGSRANLDPTTTLVPSYSEALLLLDDAPLLATDNDGQQEEVSIEGPSDKDAANPAVSGVNHRPSPSRISLLRTPKTPKRVKGATTSASVEVEAAQTLVPVINPDEPPTYEEALMFPVVEHPRPINGDNCGILRATSSAQATNQSQTPFLNEPRLPNPNARTFLSIETSL